MQYITTDLIRFTADEATIILNWAQPTYQDAIENGINRKDPDFITLQAMMRRMQAGGVILTRTQYGLFRDLCDNAPAFEVQQ